MIKINRIESGQQWRHRVVSKFPLNGFEDGKPKSVCIQKMSDGRYGVMSALWGEYFYKVYNSLDDVHNAFNEV